MNRYSVLAAAIIAAAVLYLGYVFLVTGGPAQVQGGLDAPAEADAAADANDADSDAGEGQGD